MSDKIITLDNLSKYTENINKWEDFEFEEYAMHPEGSQIKKSAKINRALKELDLYCEFTGRFNINGLSLQNGIENHTLISNLPIPNVAGQPITLTYWNTDTLSTLNEKLVQCRAWVRSDGAIAVSIYGYEDGYETISISLHARYSYSSES